MLRNLDRREPAAVVGAKGLGLEVLAQLVFGSRLKDS